jgi:hypothetical protein
MIPKSIYRCRAVQLNLAMAKILYQYRKILLALGEAKSGIRIKTSIRWATYLGTTQTSTVASVRVPQSMTHLTRAISCSTHHSRSFSYLE